MKKYAQDIYLSQSSMNKIALSLDSYMHEESDQENILKYFDNNYMTR